MTLLSAVNDALEIAAFRGVTFHMITREGPAGRRVVMEEFPGQDVPRFADLGQKAGTLKVEGWLLGADYVSRGRRLEKAFNTPGPGTLVDPWRGELKVILIGEAPITYNHQERGWAKFSATFGLFPDDAPGLLSTVAQLMDALDDVLDEARLLVASVLSPLALPLAAIGFVQGLMGYVDAAYDVLFAGPGATVVRTVAAPALTDLAASDTIALDTNWGAAIADVLAAVPAAVSDAAAPDDTPAIGPGELAPDDTDGTVDPAVAATLLLAASVQLGTLVTGAGLQTSPGPLMAALLPLAPAVEAARAATLIPFASSTDAASWRDKLDAQLAAVQGRVASLASGPVAVPMGATGAVWRAVRAARGALAADMNATVGRLPPVRTLTTPAVLDAWTIALHVAGDTPGAIMPALLDLVARNRPIAGGQVRNPGAVPPGAVELLAS